MVCVITTGKNLRADFSDHWKPLFFIIRRFSTKEARVKIIKIILAIFLPPVAAFIQVGLTKHFWINILLSVLFVFPGSIHALWLVLTDKK